MYKDFLQEASQKVVSCFYLQLNMQRGACTGRLRGSHPTSTHIPDLDNANVGNLRVLRETFKSEVSRFFILGGVIVVSVNGTERDIAGKTVSEYLAEASYDIRRIAVERNGDIVFKSQYDTTVLEDGDHLEVVSFVGGG